MPERSPEDVRVIKKLRDDLCEIHYRWSSVRELWELTAEQLRLVHSFGEHFFSVLQRVQIDDLTLALARFTDTNKAGANRTVNLGDAIERFIGKAELRVAQARLVEVWPKVKDFRDRVLAHRDYDLHVAESAAHPLAGIKWGELRDFIAEITSLMNAVDKAYDGQFYAYESPIRFGSWTTIFDALRDAETLHQLQDRVRAGLGVSEHDVLPPGEP